MHAFFCSPNFIKNENPDMRKNVTSSTDELAVEFGICLVDSKALRVYLPSGEHYMTSLEFAVSQVWPTNQCILMQRSISNLSMETGSMQMPRLFSLTHSLAEISPVLFHSLHGETTFFIDNDYRIVFASDQYDLILLYDNKNGKHLVAVLRKATDEEKQEVQGNWHCRAQCECGTWQTRNIMWLLHCRWRRKWTDGKQYEFIESQQHP